MSAAELKLNLHNLIDSIQDSKTLQAIYTLLSKQTPTEADWCDTISDEEKRAIETGVAQLKKGQGIPHKIVRKKVDALLGKK